MTKRQKKDPKRTLAIKYAYWNKWCPGGDPNKVLRTNKIDYDDPWYVTNITSPELDETLRK